VAAWETDGRLSVSGAALSWLPDAAGADERLPRNGMGWNGGGVGDVGGAAVGQVKPKRACGIRGGRRGRGEHVPLLVGFSRCFGEVSSSNSQLQGICRVLYHGPGSALLPSRNDTL
jgi:hypothetical protein